MAKNGSLVPASGSESSTMGYLPSSALSANGTTKKARKKSALVTDAEIHVNWKTLQNGSFPAFPAIFGAIDTLSQLAALDASCGVGEDTIVSVTLRSVEAIADSLHSLLLPGKKHQLDQRKHLETLNILLRFVLSRGLPLLPLSPIVKRKRKRLGGVNDRRSPEEPIHCFLEVLRGRIFIPAINAIFNLSNVYLTHLLSPRTETGGEAQPHAPQGFDRCSDTLTDLRQHILALISDNLHLLSASLPSVAGLAKPYWITALSNFRRSLMLATISELDRIISDPPSAGHLASRDIGGHRDDSSIGCNAKDAYAVASLYSDVDRRVQRLATKDSVWYLCSILHILLDHGPACQEDVRSMEFMKRDEVGKGILGINVQQANAILASATKDVLLGFVTKCQHRMLNIRGDEVPRDSGKLTRSTTSDSTAEGRNWHNQQQAGIDDVTYDMILGFVEQFTMGTTL